MDALEKLMDEGVVRVIEGFMQEIGILARLVFRFERLLRRRSVFEHRLHLGKRQRQPTLESGEALGGQAFPFAVVLLEQRGQTMLFGRRVR